MPVRPYVLLLPVALALLPGPAGARPRAAALLEQGRRALQAGNFPEAYRALALAYEQAPGPQVLYQLGLLAEAEGRTLEAQDLMQRYLEETDPEEDDPAARSRAQRIVSQARPPCSQVSVLGERRALVYLDQRLLGVLPLPLPLLVSPGPHRIAVQSGGKRLESHINVPLDRTVQVRFDARAGVVVVTLPPAVLLIEHVHNVPAPVQEHLLRQTERAVRGANLEPLPREVARELKPQLTACLEAGSCQDRIRPRADLEWVLVTRVEAAESATLSAQIIDLTTGQEAAQAGRSCPGCSPEQLGEAMAALVTEVANRGTARGRGVLEVRSDPPAEVLVGTQRLGTTPLRRLLLDGPVEVRLTQAGYRVEQRTVVIRDRETTALEVQLEMDPPEPAPPPLAPPVAQTPPPPPRPAPARRPPWRLGLGIGALGAGLLLGGFGISALSVAESCIAEPIPPARVCRQVYDTIPAGAGLLAASGVLLVGGTVLIALPPARQKVQLQLYPQPAGLALGLGGRF
ncbi:MAG: PEGA domain-containing protein [Myxococcales bacterium]|nr:PEGA domain-containing protein [Myxococcota bacterium]MDW8284454.1 PEGA domain-containing protein [Myxococcales bacterium]